MDVPTYLDWIFVTLASMLMDPSRTERPKPICDVSVGRDTAVI
jgi:hypothetical protein